MAAVLPAAPLRRRHGGVALVLAVVSLPAAYLYVGRPRRAVVYLAVALLVPLTAFLLARAGVWPAGFSWRWVAGLLIGVCAVDACRIALRHRDRFDGAWYTRWWALLAVIVMLAGMLVGFRAFFVDVFRTPSVAMLPTLHLGDEFLLSKYRGALPERGDVVVLRVARADVAYVKRVIGLPGDVVVYDRSAKRLTINGEAIAAEVIEPYPGEPDTDVVREKIGDRVHAQLSTRGLFGAGGTYEVPEGHYFVLGDHRENSLDSRYPEFGFVPHNGILGKAALVWWNTGQPMRAGTRID